MRGGCTTLLGVRALQRRAVQLMLCSFIAMLSSRSVAAGLDPNDPVYAGCPVAEEPSRLLDPSLSVDVASGRFNGWRALSPARASRQACLLETCDAKRLSHLETLNGPSQPVWYLMLVAAFALGTAAGTGVGWVVSLLR